MTLRPDRFEDLDDVTMDDVEELLSRRFVLGLLEAHATRLDPARRSAAGPFVTHLLAETAAGIETLLSLQRRSLRPDQDGNVPFHRMLHDICDQIERQMRRTRAFDLVVDVAPACAVPGRQVVRLALIASELIINAIKHAHPAGAAGLVEVACRVDPDGTVVLTVCDDGIGLPEAFDPVAQGGFGMTLIRTLSRQLGAVVTFESTGLGLMVTTTVPPPPRRH
ncbi:sensor histidine kinase [Rhodoplanes sp. TEM]|uniref:histidine kinase n=1 Tax=Rhodoplanes tepidamans TaxID=200616 RepID=A0ABT5JG64_RHOTP|nr:MULTISPECIES: sensor histidine kinase [Rhodoplanes]MDC7788564.1 sensor histidine kinase [Rhodoplanes tepidamans]MDC7986782.1 sensor histidine kinase [Rhodoplanes sp. TEM]MDQ0358545.1 two-component sensor histidine kinase [Rhodoplanes tepidamans]